MFYGINPWLALAALFSAATFLLHTFAGSRPIASPLLNASCGLSTESRYTNYYCWHLVTITLLAQSACFAWSAMPDNAMDLGVLATLLAIAFCAWNIVLNLQQQLPWAILPQWVLFLPVAILGTLGVWL